MTDLVAGIVGGSLVGTVVVGGLWRTVLGIGDARRPGTRLAASYLLRLAAAALAFGLLASLGPLPTAVGLAAFLAVRTLFIARLRIPDAGTGTDPTAAPGTPGGRPPGTGG